MENVTTVLTIMTAALIYLLPSFVGAQKKNARAIVTLNILSGWTIFGWIAAMVWASTKD